MGMLFEYFATEPIGEGAREDEQTTPLRCQPATLQNGRIG